jgi:hypothetical protein
MRSMSAAARAALLSVLVLHGASCGETELPSSPGAGAPIDAPATDPEVSYSGIPYGPYNLWGGTTTLRWGPGPFTLSQDNAFLPTSLAQRIQAARQKRIRLVLVMTGGSSSVITAGRFDLAKWKARMDRLNTSAIRKAVADGVADGTIIGNKLLDEPENPKWGGVLNKAMIDGMAAYARNIFPTLPMGVGHGAPGFKWRSGERYKVLDWVIVQYVYHYNQGKVTDWRDQVLNFARANGVTPMFSLNILNGGVMDMSGAWDCPNTGGKGTRTSYCRMTAEQVRTYGRTIGPFGCALLMWQFDDAFMSKAANRSAFADVATLLNSKPRRSCRRP